MNAGPSDPEKPRRYRWLSLFLTARFARFLVFGGLAALVNLAVGGLLYSSPRISIYIPYWLAVGIGAGAGLVANFAMNYAYNFRYFGRSPIAQFRTFVIVALGGVVLTAIIAEFTLNLAGWVGLGSHVPIGSAKLSTAFVAHVAAVGLVTFYSYAAHSAFSFNEGLRVGLRRVLTPRK